MQTEMQDLYHLTLTQDELALLATYVLTGVAAAVGQREWFASKVSQARQLRQMHDNADASIALKLHALLSVDE